VTHAEAGRMLDELKSRVLLEGVRGKLPVDRETLVRAMSAVTCFGAAAGDRLKELDFNPGLSGPKGVSAVDWLLVLHEA